MERQDILAVILSTLASIAPEVEPGELRTAEPLRSQVDLDSMDWLNFLIGLHQAFRIAIPESDYARLRTLDDLAGYIAAKLA